jgi:hypothetical protein
LRHTRTGDGRSEPDFIAHTPLVARAGFGFAAIAGPDTEPATMTAAATASARRMADMSM